MNPEENTREEVEKDIHIDKTIIIGFTGPIGSGCSELSKFLESRNNEFGDFLFKSGYINEVMSSEINHNILDNKIKTYIEIKQQKRRKLRI